MSAVNALGVAAVFCCGVNAAFAYDDGRKGVAAAWAGWAVLVSLPVVIGWA